MKEYCLKPIITFALLLTASLAHARDNITIVGSSTVFPFTTVVAETYARKTESPSPIVESTGTGGGFKLFCSGVGESYPDATNASRAIKPSEEKDCAANGITPIELKLGYDGIVMAQAKDSEDINLTLKQIFLALARLVPVNGELVENPYKTWSEIDPTLPNYAIKVLGPPPTSGTRDAFLELAMEEGAREFPFIQNITDKKEFKAVSHSIREDGAYIEAGEQDNLIVRKLESDDQLVGIFGFSFLEQNQDRLKGLKVENVIPTFEDIASKKYKISRPLFVYIKKEHLNLISGLKDFVKEYISEDALSEDGYLVERSLIPLPDDEYEEISNRILQELN